jgi:hypothetical protein
VGVLRYSELKTVKCGCWAFHAMRVRGQLRIVDSGIL